MVRPLLLLGCVGWAPGAWAAEVRYGIFVGNNHGQSTDVPLMFATTDAEKMRDLFVEYGNVKASDATLLRDATARQVQHALEQVTSRLRADQAAGHDTSLVFYYSGHGDAQDLHLGTTQLGHEELRTWLDASGADVRLAFIDACQSGSMVRRKGGTRGPGFAFAVDVESTRGTAILTSSAASELSQESLEVGGGFFTHYLHSALSGSADRNRDGVVTLTEANAWVHTETAFGTRETPGAQTPRFDFDLVGSGDLVLTELEEASSHLSFLGDLEGALSVWDESRKRYVAEVTGTSAVQLAVRPGVYYVHRRMPGWVDEGRYTVRRGETLSVLEEDFVSVSYEEVASRGDLERAARRARMPDLTLRMVLGVRSFGAGSVYGAEYVPAHGIGGIEARFIGQGKTFWGFDALTGGAGADLTFPEVGEVPVNVSSSSFGATAGFATGPRWLRAGIGGKGEVVGFRRTFLDRDEPTQASMGLAAGISPWAGVHYGRFTGDVQWAMLMLFSRWDDQPSFPVYSEVTLQLGYRF